MPCRKLINYPLFRDLKIRFAYLHLFFHGLVFISPVRLLDKRGNILQFHYSKFQTGNLHFIQFWPHPHDVDEAIAALGNIFHVAVGFIADEIRHRGDQYGTFRYDSPSAFRLITFGGEIHAVGGFFELFQPQLELRLAFVIRLCSLKRIAEAVLSLERVKKEMLRIFLKSRITWRKRDRSLDFPVLRGGAEKVLERY